MRLCALAATESRSLLPVSKLTYIYSTTFLLPALVLMLLCYQLKKGCELVAENKPEKKVCFQLDGLLVCCCELNTNNPQHKEVQVTACLGHRPGWGCALLVCPPHPSGVLLHPKTQHTDCWSTLLCCHAFGILLFWQWCPVRWGIAKQSEIRLAKGLPLQSPWWMGTKLVPLSFSCLRHISSLIAGSYP